MADGPLERAARAENAASSAPMRLAGTGPKDARWMGWVAVAVVLGLWELGCWLGNINSLYLPRPSQIVASMVKLFVAENLVLDLGWTLWRIFAGCAIGVVAGILMGVWMATSPRVAAIADVFIAALYPLPKVTLIPLLVIWLGTGGPFMLTISALGAFFPVVINTLLGVRQCDPGLVLAARDLGANQRQIVRRVLIPSAVPSIFAGVRLGLGVSIILVVAAEMVVGRTGLGARLFLAGQVLNTEDVFAVLVVLATLGIVVTKLQDMVDERLARWRPN